MKLFKFGVQLFDSREFNHFLAGKVFRWSLAYLDIYLEKQFKLEIIHNNDEYYYDGYHNHIWIGWIIISYGT